MTGWSQDYHSHRTYLIWCEWPDGREPDEETGEHNPNEGMLVVSPKVIEGDKVVGPGTCINVLEAQGMIVKWMIPVPHCRNIEEDA
jgi:hypothetical protein